MDLNGPVVAGVIAFLGGVFSIVCAVKDYDWFMENHKAWLFVKLFGRNGARIVYALLGLALAGVGVILVLGGNRIA